MMSRNKPSCFGSAATVRSYLGPVHRRVSARAGFVAGSIRGITVCGLVCALSAGLVAGCDHATGEQSPIEQPEAEQPPVEQPPADTEVTPLPAPTEALSTDRRLTRPDIALGNLSAQIDSLRTRYDIAPTPLIATTLVGSLTSRAHVLGSSSDLQSALAIGEAATLQWPTNHACWSAYADALSALHRFDQAIEAADEAVRLGADMEHLYDTVAITRTRNVDDVVARRIELAERAPNHRNLSALAAAYTSAGLYIEADAAYVAALNAYTDVAPFPIAWTQFQRGVLWGEYVGNSDAAAMLYQDAVQLLPQYVVSNVHLAEIEAETSPEAAVARLRAVTVSEDPEPWARLAQYGTPEDAPAAIAEADARYTALLAVEPLAYSDHAAEFYLAAGNDPSRALQLAELNLENRQTDRSYELTLRAALDAGQESRACDLVADAADGASRAGLLELLETLEMSCAN